MGEKIFICYRRGEDWSTAILLHEYLVRIFPAEEVMLDSDGGLPAGSNFVKMLSERIAKCDVVLAIISKKWISLLGEDGRPRLENPEDWVRIELEAALAQGKRIIPLLIKDALPLKENQLPVPLRELAQLQAIQMSSADFQRDVLALAEDIKRIHVIRIAEEEEKRKQLKIQEEQEARRVAELQLQEELKREERRKRAEEKARLLQEKLRSEAKAKAKARRFTEIKRSAIALLREGARLWRHVLAVLLLAIATWLVYTYVHQALVNRQHTQQLTSAGFDKGLLTNFLDTCKTDCPPRLDEEARQRISTVQAEEARYHDAVGHLDLLRSYIGGCMICQFKANAAGEVDKIEARQREQATTDPKRQQDTLATQLQLAGKDRTALAQFVSNCGPQCPKNIVEEAHRKIDDLNKHDRFEQLLAELSSATNSPEGIHSIIQACDASCPPEFLQKARLAELNAWQSRLEAASSSVADLARFIATCQADCPTEISVKANSALTQMRAQRTFQTFDSRDADGFDLRTIENISQADCETQCNADDQCQGYSFDKWNKYCFLKSKVETLFVNPKSIVRMLASSPQPDVSGQTFYMQRYRGKNFPGNGYRTTTVRSFEQCESECLTDQVCLAFSFSKSTKACRSFSSTGQYFTNAGTDSGVKRQDK